MRNSRRRQMRRKNLKRFDKHCMKDMKQKLKMADLEIKKDRNIKVHDTNVLGEVEVGIREKKRSLVVEQD